MIDGFRNTARHPAAARARSGPDFPTTRRHTVTLHPLVFMLIETLATPVSVADESALIAVFTDAVHAGASIGYLAPLPESEARGYWAKIFADLPGGMRVLFVARETPGGPIVGTVQLAGEHRPNGRHRAEVQKLLVLTSQRRRGIGSQLMRALEREARQRKLTLLFLDTSEGPGGACGLYDSLGYTHAGGIPGYALDPDGTPKKNAIYWKQL